MNVENFKWPRALRAPMAEAEQGALSPRQLYPVEIKGFCDLVAGAPIPKDYIPIAPGLTARCVEIVEPAEHGSYPWARKRAAYEFLMPLKNGRVWQSVLRTEWIYPHERGAQIKLSLHPRNIVQALSRVIERGENERGAQ